jgi:hypothetical protein
MVAPDGCRDICCGSSEGTWRVSSILSSVILTHSLDNYRKNEIKKWIMGVGGTCVSFLRTRNRLPAVPSRELYETKSIDSIHMKETRSLWGRRCQGDCHTAARYASLRSSVTMREIFPGRHTSSKTTHTKEKIEMASKKKIDNIKKDSTTRQGKERAKADTAPESTAKVDDLIHIICQLADAEGYFDPKDVQAQVRATELAKSASIIMSNLRLQGFSQGDKLRVPVSQGFDLIKKFINLASRLRKKAIMVSFEDAVDGLCAEAALPSATEEPKAEPVREAISEPMPGPAPIAEPEPSLAPPPPSMTNEVPVAQEPTEDFTALYKEAHERALKLEAELAAYKEICARLIDSRGK